MSTYPLSAARPASAPAPARSIPWVLYGSFALAMLLAVGLTLSDPYLSALVPPRIWQRLRLQNSPFQALFLVLPLALATSVIAHYLSRAPDTRSALIVLIVIGMQINGLRPVGVDLLTFMPFIALGYVLAECLARPRVPLHLTGAVFFGMALLLLDVPHLADTNEQSPARFVINLMSMTRSVLIGVALILLIDQRKHLEIAIRAVVLVGALSALVGVMQMVLLKVAGISFSLAPPEADMKPTFLGTVLRASGLTTWAQWLADFQIIAIPFALMALARARTRRRTLVALASLTIMFAAVFFTFTYAAWFGCVVILVAWAFARWPQRSLHFLLFGLLAGTVFYMAGGFNWLRDSGLYKFGNSSGMLDRQAYLHATLDELIRDPWLGRGIYTDEDLSGNFQRKRVHNAGLQAWLYFGLPGLLIFVAMTLWLLTQSTLMAVLTRGRDRQIFQCLAIALGAAILTMFAQPALVAQATWFLVGLASAAIRVVRSDSSPGRQP